MTLADLSIKRPTFITCVIFLMLAVGWLAMNRLGVDLFPNVTFPVVVVTTPYPGAGPSEIETLVSRPLEEEIGTLAGLKRLSSTNREGVSVVIAEFSLETDIKFAEQQIRDRVGSAKRNLPDSITEPTIRRVDPSDQPVLVLSLAASLKPSELFDLADQVVKAQLEQVNQVGLVDILGGRKREIQVTLDRAKLKAREISAGQVAMRLASTGENIPAGKVNQGAKETVFRTLGEYKSVQDVENTIVNFFGNDVPVTIRDVGHVSDTLVDENSRTFVNGKQSLLLYIYKQSGTNTIAVVDALKKRTEKLNAALKNRPGNGSLTIIRDGSLWIRANVEDLKESIGLGILLAVIVVFYFLGSGRSTIITGLALPNSLIGAFVLMAACGFTINIMTLLALSLAVGLLIDDAIVVRENIFRHIEMGSEPVKAAKEGTLEVTMAVIATTLAVIAVFAPVGFLKGVVGQFFREFGLTVCFAMIISLFDALTIAPMLSAYFAGRPHGSAEPATSLAGKAYENTIGYTLKKFGQFQDWLEVRYEGFLRYTIKNPFKILAASFMIFLGSCATVAWVPKTFLPPQDAGEFAVGLDLPPGTSLDHMSEVANKVDEVIRQFSEVEVSSLTVGSRDGESNVAEFYVKLIPYKNRPGISTSNVKERLRQKLKDFAETNPKVKDYDAVGGGQRPFNLNIVSNDPEALQKIAESAYAKLKDHPALKDVDIDFRPGKPEIQIVPDKHKMQQLGISTATIGTELRAQVEGVKAAKFRENGLEYDVRVRMQENQRDLRTAFGSIYVPNVNNTMIRLADVSSPVEAVGPSKITRQDRARYIGINADISPTGPGMGGAMSDVAKMFQTDIPLPPGTTYSFVGQAENFQELGESMALAMGLGVLFIFLVLSSLYESFVTPFTIMLALPLAICGAFVALAVTQQSLNIFSIIGIVMLLGVASKNSILLVDMANRRVADGASRSEAMIEAGKNRLRPILMTTMALIAGAIPIALGLNEASKQRTSMGVAIVGGLVSSTLLTLLVVPAAYSFVDRFRIWSKVTLGGWFGVPMTDLEVVRYREQRAAKKAAKANLKGSLAAPPATH